MLHPSTSHTPPQNKNPVKGRGGGVKTGLEIVRECNRDGIGYINCAEEEKESRGRGGGRTQRHRAGQRQTKRRTDLGSDKDVEAEMDKWRIGQID